jgi:tRNA1(Val) A37 N6-methylase TrmN6
MPLFQNAVLNKYLSGVDEIKVDEAWEKFKVHFHNHEVQQNIREAKEESYQEGFLDDLFVKILGYTKSPAPNYNLVVEQKNLTDSKKADGALLDGEKVRGVIELKGTETTDLSKVETQAFGYKNKQPDALYVIISNFEKLRFYIDNAVDFLEFNLFTLTKEEFKLLWLCLGYSNFAKGLPKKIKDASLTEEENVTKKLYKDYSDFKNAVFESIKKHNPEYDKLLLFKKTQKLLDRFLFIFFAEDRLLLPPNSIREIIKQWMDLRDKYDEYVPLYERFKKYFGYMNEGYKGKNHEIFAYNGGLFVEDEVLDNLKIDDELLYKHTMQLSNYDFDSEVDVNILGHIFEHSLNEIEEITAELEGQKVDTSKTRRKKDGVFYTPKYITKYIVENTVGKLCLEQKSNLKIEDEDYRPNRQKKTKKELLGKLDKYREWLLELTICDPACGSGAFLNQALEFLIEEHTYVDELQAKLLDQPLVIPDIENQILENNLFGVDINEESVEIAKLSLWLRTAQKGRKLTSLNNHIKCGNSLIDDPEVAGEKAFKWEKEFPAVFANGGFDVVIGNPPYVRVENISLTQKDYFQQCYSSFKGRADLYVYFYEISIELVKKAGYISFITPNKWFKTKYGENLRDLMKELQILEITDFFELKIFEDASTEPQIIVFKNLKGGKTFKYIRVTHTNNFITNEVVRTQINKSNLESIAWVFIPQNIQLILNKISSTGTNLKTYTNNGIGYGIKTGYNEAFIIDEETKNRLVNSNSANAQILSPYLSSQEFDEYYADYQGKWLINSYHGLSKVIDKIYPEVYDHLIKYKEKLENRAQVRRGDHHWTELDNNPSNEMFEIFKKNKIIYIHTAVNHFFYFDEFGYSINNSCYFIKNADGYLSSILNSCVFEFYKKHKFVAYGDPSKKGRCKLDRNKMDHVPIPPVSESKRKVFIKKVNENKRLADSLKKIQGNLIVLLLSKYDFEKLSRKLQIWHELTFKQFLKELKKKKVELTLDKEAEWMEYFNQQKAQAEDLKSQMAQTDKEIDAMVYELYGLNEEEVKVVENNSK